jgi:hypothetical protein
MSLDFLLTAICFSILGYVLCYLTISTYNSKIKNSYEENLFYQEHGRQGMHGRL